MAQSQLKQLKASLKSHGLIGQTKKTKKGQKSAEKNRTDREETLQSIRQAFNPFEIKTTHKKQDVLGRHVQGATGKPGISKRIGEEQRRRAYELASRKNKAGGVVDRRFGENDKNMTPEEKMLARFTRERLSKSSKKSVFNLDDEGDDSVLTHYGQSLTLDDDFQEDDLGVEDDETGDDDVATTIRQKRVLIDEASAEEDREIKKSKKEVMQEVIAKSKLHKYERQAAKQRDLEVIDELDAKENIDSLFEDLATIASKPDRGEQAKDDYEQVIREMAFDRRAKPSDRTKTEDELAKEKADSLLKLEKDRAARMEGEIDDGYDNEHQSDTENFNDADVFGLKTADEITDDELSDDVDEEIDEVDDDEVDDDGDDEVEDHADEIGSRGGVWVDYKRASVNVKDSLPCPQTVIELTELLDNHEVKMRPSIIQEIVSKYHPRLAEGNKQKLSQFTIVLAEYILSTTNDPDDNNGSIIDALFRNLKQLVADNVELFSNFCRAKLHDLSSKLEENRWENVDILPSDLFLFTLVGLLFSASDHFHLVVTSATIIMAQHLSQCPIRSLRDCLVGLYLCETFLIYQRIAARYVPEVPTFLVRLLTFLLPQSPAISEIFVDNTTNMPVPDTSLVSAAKLVPFKLTDLLTDNQSDLYPQLLLATIELSSKFGSLWREKQAFSEIFQPLCLVVSSVRTIHPIAESAASKMERLVQFSRKERQPLTLQSHRPLPIQTLTPKFEDNYSIDKKSYDDDRERNEMSKLKAELKKERKAALRDFRRDAAFIAREKIKAKRQTDKEYHEKLQRLERTIATEEGAEKNQYERDKQARKRRR
jgi:nucleolar protein 14